MPSRLCYYRSIPQRYCCEFSERFAPVIAPEGPRDRSFQPRPPGNLSESIDGGHKTIFAALRPLLAANYIDFGHGRTLPQCTRDLYSSPARNVCIS